MINVCTLHDRIHTYVSVYIYIYIYICGTPPWIYLPSEITGMCSVFCLVLGFLENNRPNFQGILNPFDLDLPVLCLG